MSKHVTAFFNDSVILSHIQALNKALQSVMGKSNLRFAGMSIAVSISIDGLGLLIPTTRQVTDFN